MKGNRAARLLLLGACLLVLCGTAWASSVAASSRALAVLGTTEVTTPLAVLSGTLRPPAS